MAGDMGGPPLTGYTCTHMHPTCVPPRRARSMYIRTRRALIIHSAFCTLLPCLACLALPSLALVCCTPHGIASPLSTVEREFNGQAIFGTPPEFCCMGNRPHSLTVTWFIRGLVSANPQASAVPRPLRD